MRLLSVGLGPRLLAKVSNRRRWAAVLQVSGERGGARAQPAGSFLWSGLQARLQPRLFPQCCRRGSEERSVGRGLSREPRDLSGLSEVVWDHPWGGGEGAPTGGKLYLRRSPSEETNVSRREEGQFRSPFHDTISYGSAASP